MRKENVIKVANTAEPIKFNWFLMNESRKNTHTHAQFQLIRNHFFWTFIRLCIFFSATIVKFVISTVIKWNALFYRYFLCILKVCYWFGHLILPIVSWSDRRSYKFNLHFYVHQIEAAEFLPKLIDKIWKIKKTRKWTQTEL